MSEQTNQELDEQAVDAGAEAVQAADGNGEDPGQQVDAGSVEGAAAGEGYEPENFNGLDDGLSGGATEGDTKLDVILDIPVTLSMEIGRTSVSIKDLLQLARGSVVELDRMAGEPLDVLVNGTLVARGEVVVVNDKFGVRLNQVISPSERVRSLK